MLGTIIGDIVGSRFEFDGVAETGFELFTDDCDYTDDTICTVAVADAILNNRSYKEALLDWCRRYPNPKGAYGGMFSRWLAEVDPQPQSSFGNGSAMRVGSVGWLFHTFREVQQQAEQSAIVSHCHKEGIKGAQCVATVIYWLRTVRISKDLLIDAVKRNFGYEIPSLKDIYRIGNTGHFDATCQETVPYALRCFVESTNFEDAIRKAVMARGDTDTKAAICGSMAEAYYEIPDWMAEKACEYLPKDMLQIVEQFYSRLQTNIND